MPEMRICPDCGALADKVTYETGRLVWSTPEGEGPRTAQGFDVWECSNPDCPWEEDAEDA